MAISVQPDEAPAGVVRTAFGETAASLRLVFGHHASRRTELALSGLRAVTASEDSVLLSLAGSPFLEAVTGSVESSTAVEDVVSYRMRF